MKGELDCSSGGGMRRWAASGAETPRGDPAGCRTCTPFAPGGRPMREYVVLPSDVIADKRKLGAWLKRAITYVETLPAKKPKKAKRG